MARPQVDRRDQFHRSPSSEKPFGDGPEYDIYPHDLTEPYKTRRGAVAREMYELVGITRDDAAGRAAQMKKNFAFFGAPVGMFLTIDRQMGPPQFADLGIFLQSLMLLARERGLHSWRQASCSSSISPGSETGGASRSWRSSAPRFRTRR